MTMEFPGGVPDHPIRHHQRGPLPVRRLAARLLALVVAILAALRRHHQGVQEGALLILAVYAVWAALR